MVIIKPSKNQQRKLQRRWRQKARKLAEAERRRLKSLPKPRVKVIKGYRNNGDVAELVRQRPAKPPR